MRSILIRRARFALVAAASLGLVACAEPSMQRGWDGLMAAIRDANAATRTAQADRSTAPAEAPAAKSATADSATVRQTAAVTASAAKPAAEPAARSATAPDLAALQRQLNELEGRITALTAENQRQMERLSLMTNGAIADMEQLFNSLRLELRTAPSAEPGPGLKRRRPLPTTGQALPSGQGGPFLPWPPKPSPSALASGDPVEPLLPDLQNLFLMHQIAMALPLSAPLEDAVVTGPFGHRRDPFNRRSAFHDGIDLQAPMRTPVRAAAAGTVIVAGVRPAYGRVVEIDHGFGIRTRYAHLATLAVREGERVERHAAIGQLGSSGRSASPHLHYEVLFNGRPHDPAALLKLAEGIRAAR
jgi:murein DD-endopeptidase MepM/ murein hydrolase activator NlpD